MKRHLKTDFRLFILERIKNATKQKEEIEEVQPDDIESNDESEDDTEFDFDEIEGEDESQDDDDLIEELHRKYKKLQRLYEHRLHQRKRK